MPLNIQDSVRPTGGEVVVNPDNEATRAPQWVLAIIGAGGLFFAPRTGDDASAGRSSLCSLAHGEKHNVHPRLCEILESARSMTASGYLVAQNIRTFFTPDISFGERATDYHERIYWKDWPVLEISRIDSVSSVPETTEAIASPRKHSEEARRLREVSGLEVERLAKIFGVSRTSYYNWTTSSTPRGPRRGHLLEVLPLVEEVSQRLRDPSTVSNWLLTPVSPNGKKPIDYLETRQYELFRGFVLRLPSEFRRIQPLGALKPVSREYSREEFDEVLRALSPRPWRDEELQSPNDKAGAALVDPAASDDH